MNVSDNLKNLYNQAVSNDGKVDAKEFEGLKKEILQDNVLDKDEKAFLTDILSKQQLEKGVIPSVTELFSENYKEKDSPLKALFEISESNDGVIDSKEFGLIKKEMLSDNKLQASETEILYNKLAEGKIQKETIATVFEFVSENTETEKAETKAAETTTEEKKPDVKPSEAVQENKNDAGWDHKFGIRGNFNFTDVSDGWSQYGNEQSATRIEGGIDAELNYKTGNHKWNNKLLVEYGNVWVKDQEKALSKDNTEFTTEYSHTALKKGNFSIEIPFLKLYTKGPMTTLGNRTIRESTGGKLVYENKEQQGKYSLGIGGGIQQSHNPDTKKWLNEPGVEVVAEVSQNLKVLQKPLATVFEKKEEDFSLLNRVEVTASANAFVPLKEGFSWSSTDLTVRSGAKVYLNEGQNLWLGVSRELRYGGKADSTLEQRTSVDLGLKF